MRTIHVCLLVRGELGPFSRLNFSETERPCVKLAMLKMVPSALLASVLSPSLVCQLFIFIIGDDCYESEEQWP